MRRAYTADAVSLPLQLDDVTREWVGHALAVRHPGVEVTRLNVGEVLWGSATKVWLQLAYNDAGRQAGLPPTMLLKTGFDPKMRQLAAAAYARETRFFDAVAATLKMPLPRCYYAGTDPESAQSALLLEDLVARSCTFGRIFIPLGVDKLAETLALLARLHASYWNRTGAPALRGLDQNQERVAIIDFLVSEPNWERCLGAPRAKDIPAPIRNRERVAHALARLREHDRRGPRCLIHGDAHVGNMYFENDGSPRFLDWQAASIGCWDQDVAYIITCALTTEDRRANEQALLKHYLEELRARGVKDAPAFENAWDAHRRQVAYGILGLLCTPEMQTEEFAGIMGTRFALAMDDLDTLNLLV